MMIMVEKRYVDGYGSGSFGPEEPYQFYAEKVDISRLPRIFRKCDADDDKYVVEGEETGVYMLPGDDIDLLSMCHRPSPWSRDGNFRPSEIYLVEVNADSCTVEECLELLKRIACDDRFITCSVESARLFYADLNENEAVKLKGLNEIRSVYPRSSLMVDL